MENNSKLKALQIKSLNEQIIIKGKRGEKRPTPTYSKTNFTPHAKKVQLDIDSDTMEVNEDIETIDIE